MYTFSLRNCRTPAERLAFNRTAEDLKQRRLRRIAALEAVRDTHGTARFRRERIQALRTAASSVQLALDAAGRPVEAEIDRTLALMEEMVPHGTRASRPVVDATMLKMATAGPSGTRARQTA